MLGEENLSHKLISKSFWSYFLTFVIAPTGYLIRVIISRELSIAEIGFFYSLLGFLSLLSIYNDLGLTESIRYFLPQYRLKKKYDSYKTIWYVTLFVQIVSSVIIGVFLWFSATRLANNYFHFSYGEDIIRIFVLYFFCMNIIEACMSFFIAFQNIVYEKLLDVVRMYSILVFTLFFRFFGTITLDKFSFIWFLGLVISMLFALYLGIKKYGYTLLQGKVVLYKKQISQRFSYSLWVFLGIHAGTILLQVDQQMIIFFLGAESAGYYSNYLSLLNLYSILFAPVITLIFPIITELVTKKDSIKISFLLSIVYKYFSVVGFALGLFFFIFGPTIASILYGERFLYSGVLMKYASLFILFNILTALNYGVLAGLGKAKQRVKILSLVVLFNILANLLLIVVGNLGLLGAVIATIISWFLLFIFTFRLIYSQYTFAYSRKFMIKNICWTLIFGFGIWSLATTLFPYLLIEGNIFVRISILGGLGLLYMMLLLGVNYKNVLSVIVEIKHIRSK